MSPSERKVITPIEEYLNLIKSLFRDHGKGLTRELFARYGKELSHLIQQQVALQLPDAGIAAEKEMGTMVIDRIAEIMGDKPSNVVVMPAGDYARSVARCFDPEKIKVMAFLDNFKTGMTPENIPIRKPEQVNDLAPDLVIVATPSYGTQMILRSQVQGVAGEDIEFLLTGDMVLGRRLRERGEDRKNKAEAFLDAVSQLTPEPGKKLIVFAVTSFPVHYVAHLRALRRQGHKTVLISLSGEIMYGNDFHGFAREFDETLTAGHDPLLFFEVMAALTCDLLYTVDHSLYNWFCLMIRDLFHGRQVVEVYDLSDNAGYDKGQGVRNAEKDLGIDMDALENYSRNLLYREVNGLIYRDSPDLMDKAKEIFHIKKPALRFLPYPECYETLKDVDGEEHMVFSGHILNNPNELVYTVLDLARELSGQHIHMHFFNPADQTGAQVPEFSEEARKNKYIHYHRPLPPEFHNYCMRMYNWGWLVYDFKDQTDEDIERHAYTFTSRLLAYVNAGLPVICSEESTYQVDIVRQYGIGLIVSRRDVPVIGSIIQNSDYALMKAHVMELRREWDIHSRLDEFESFIKAI